MEIDTDDDILRKVALDGTMDYSSWPRLLPTVLARIEKIAHNDFPIPVIPPPRPLPEEPRLLEPLPSSDPIEAPDSSDTRSSSQETNKENTTPAGPQSSSLPSSAPVIPEEAPEPLEPGALPRPVAAMLRDVTETLSSHFAQRPPHTVQRLAELVLAPRQHYRSLVAYLHALDRVVRVSSGANVYPLPPAVVDMNGVGEGGAASSAAAFNVGNDEALVGGALLTPIPWLARRAASASGDEALENGGGGGGHSAPGPAQPAAQQQQQQQQATQQPTPRGGRPQVRTEHTETIDGPNGMGSIETVSVSVNGIPSIGASAAAAAAAAALQRGVTQGELLRQEQRAGVVPVSQLARSGAVNTGPVLAGSGIAHAGAGQSAVATATGDGDGDGDAAMEMEDEEVPHARGPEEIGIEDTGPQSEATSYLISGGSGLAAHGAGVDVGAAAATRTSPEHQQQRQSGVSPGAAVPASPKREAEEELDDSIAKKRLKEAGDGGAAMEEVEGEEKPRSKGQEEDAEGDVVLSEAPPTGDELSKGEKGDGAGGGVKMRVPPSA